MQNYVKDRSKSYQFNYRAETLEPLKNLEPPDFNTKFHVSGQLAATTMRILETRQNDPIQRGRHHRTLELPSHPDLEFYEPWKFSTNLTDKEKTEALDQKTEKALKFTRKVSEILPSKKEYIGPMKSISLLQKEIRLLKEKGQFDSSMHLHFSNGRLKSRHAKEEASGKNRFFNEKFNIVKTLEHSGVWEHNQLEGKSMWSDTGSYDFESPGDIVKSVNLDRMNLAGPVKNSRRLHTSSPPKSSNRPAAN